jgi:hypothetical protein
MVPEIKKIINDAYIKKYGMHPLKTEEVKNKRVKTCLEKYGGHPNQNKEVQVKSEATSYHYKEYMMPSGNIIKYQGYENLALNELIHIYDEEDILTGRANIPIINYYIDNTKHVYFPDLFIKSENKIIEVKSEWTIKLKRGNIEEKASATIKAGYKYEIWVYNEGIYIPNGKSHIRESLRRLLGSFYTIYDYTGKAILTGKILSEQSDIDLGDLSKGIYLLSIGENLDRTFKIVKE